MSHLFPLLFLLLPGLIYLLGYIRRNAGKTSEALSYAKFMSLMSRLLGAMARKVGRTSFCTSTRWRGDSNNLSDPYSRVLHGQS